MEEVEEVEEVEEGEEGEVEEVEEVEEVVEEEVQVQGEVDNLEVADLFLIGLEMLEVEGLGDMVVGMQ